MGDEATQDNTKQEWKKAILEELERLEWISVHTELGAITIRVAVEDDSEEWPDSLS